MFMSPECGPTRLLLHPVQAGDAHGAGAVDQRDGPGAGVLGRARLLQVQEAGLEGAGGAGCRWGPPCTHLVLDQHLGAVLAERGVHERVAGLLGPGRGPVQQREVGRERRVLNGGRGGGEVGPNAPPTCSMTAHRSAPSAFANANRFRYCCRASWKLSSPASDMTIFRITEPCPKRRRVTGEVGIQKCALIIGDRS